MKTRNSPAFPPETSGKKPSSARVWGLAAIVGCGLGLFIAFKHLPTPAAPSPGTGAALEIEHPLAGAVMPSNLPSPLVLWKTNGIPAVQWEAVFQVGGQNFSFPGTPPRWRAAAADWARIKTVAKEGPVELVITGYADAKRRQPLASGRVRFAISRDAVTASLFYRDVNLPFSEAVKDPSKIRWRFGSLATGTLPPVVMENLPVCGNCHSFDRRGEHLAMDVDYANNKGSYVIVPTASEMRLTPANIITWDDYHREDGQETLGLLSQISPDGRYVLSTVKDLSIFMPKPDLAFSQLFFPFQGILGVYDRQTRRFAALPGADDPELVQSNPTWSPDGQWVIFARTRAVRLKQGPARGKLLLSQKEDEELFRQTKEFRYDLYRLPFNGGQGGKAEPLTGASRNGRSNYFPKYSPNGRWIVYCQAANYMLLQPDSELYIVPAEGGEPRRLKCNLGRMNSWHSWSPDSQWLVFTSKAHSDYSQLYLTRIDESGEASPPVWLDYLIEPGRVVNIPEFVDLPGNAIAHIREQFLDDLSYVRAGNEFLRAGDAPGAITKYRLALEANASNAVAHRLLGQLLKDTPQKTEAFSHLQAAVELAPHDALARFSLGCACATGGDFTRARQHFEEGVRWLPENPEEARAAVDGKHRLTEALYYRLGLACLRLNQPAEAERQFRAVLREDASYGEACQQLGLLLLAAGKLEEAGGQFAEATRLLPQFGPAHNCLGLVRGRQGREAEAALCFQKAVQCDPNDWQAHFNLGRHHLAVGAADQAREEFQQTLRLNPAFTPAQQALAKLQGQTEAAGK